MSSGHSVISSFGPERAPLGTLFVTVLDQRGPPRALAGSGPTKTNDFTFKRVCSQRQDVGDVRVRDLFFLHSTFPFAMRDVSRSGAGVSFWKAVKFQNFCLAVGHFKF